MFERLVFINIHNYLKQNHLITRDQSDLTPGDSGKYQLLSLVHNMHLAFDEKSGLEIRCVYFDMSIAFEYGTKVFCINSNKWY